MKKHIIEIKTIIHVDSKKAAKDYLDNLWFSRVERYNSYLEETIAIRRLMKSGRLKCTIKEDKIQEDNIDKITEEVLTNLIKRVEALEAIGIKPNYPIKTGMATERQLGYIKQLRGETYEGMTKQDAATEIEKRLKLKNEEQTIPPQILTTEPEEVDTEDAGLDEEGLL